jgi:hypothetical protein
MSGQDQQAPFGVHSCTAHSVSVKLSSTSLTADGDLYGCDVVMPHISGTLNLMVYNPFTEAYEEWAQGAEDQADCIYCTQLPRHIYDTVTSLSPNKYRWVFQWNLTWPASITGQTYGVQTHDWTLP